MSFYKVSASFRKHGFGFGEAKARLELRFALLQKSKVFTMWSGLH